MSWPPGAPPSSAARSAVAAARLLDLSRLVSRVGRGARSGIDRVEAAWLEVLLDRPEPLFALVRAAPGHVLLDRAGAAALRARLEGAQPWGPQDWLARLHLRQGPARRRAMADLRRLALGQSGARGLRRLLAAHLPPGTIWIATGHANLDPACFAAVQALPGGRAVVMLHDTIPLDAPHLSRPRPAAAFACRVALTGARADLVAYPSAVSRAAAEAHFAAAGRVPPGVVAPLAVRLAAPGPLPPGLDPRRPIFLALGTVEPRKNHALLLDLWEGLARRLPPERLPLLVVVGAPGWNTAAVLARLAAPPPGVMHLPGPDDATVSALLRHARALLFPSLAEGFGLPPCEAAALGVPVLCSDLPVLREVLGDRACFLPPAGPQAWRRAILALADPASPPLRHRPRPPGDWRAHVAGVLAALEAETGQGDRVG